MNNHRTRWAAIGATTAVTLGAGGLSLASAAGGSSVEIFEPCRLLATRDDFKVGETDRLGPDSTTTVGASGVAGECEIPAGATGLSVNVIGLNVVRKYREQYD